MDVIPTSIKRQDASTLLIQWSDGSARQYAASALRSACPCATCKEKSDGLSAAGEATGPVNLPVLSLAEANPLAITGMKPVGNYAYNIAFSDGHDSGIYQLAYLHELGQPG